MYRISEVEIMGMWGYRDIKVSLRDDVNIFIGRNGTGKTTFINILMAVLSVDLKMLSDNWFDRVVIDLVDDGVSPKKKKKIQVERYVSDESFNDEIVYKISRNKFSIPLAVVERHLNNMYARRRIYPVVEHVRAVMAELISVSSIAVHRLGLDDPDSSISERRSKDGGFKNPIDSTLEALMARFTEFQLSLSQSVKEISNEFQRDVLLSMLYDSQVDDIDLSEVIDIDLSKEKEVLLDSYRDLGVLDKGNVKKKIDKHFDKLQESMDAIKEYQVAKGSQKILVSKFIPLPLLKRTKHITDMGRAAKAKRDKVMLPVSEFVSELSSYFKDKKVSFDDQGRLVLNKSGGQISFSDLSSGEKQVLILLTESLLQSGGRRVFIADEPELSLHIEWQSKVISSVRRLNGNSQIIVATHSPEVAAKYADSIIDMEDVSNG